MNKFFSVILLILLPMMASADAVEINGIYYNLISKTHTAEVTSRPSGTYSGDIVIPAFVEYQDIVYTVNSIGDYAFQYSASMTNVSIPNTITYIGKYTFSGCNGLIDVDIPNSVLSIGIYAFANCDNVISIKLPNNISSINDGTFAYCLQLCDISIPLSVTSIGGSAFYNCSKLTSIIIPNAVTSFGHSAFAGSGLINITIPPNVTNLGWQVFKNCDKLQSVSIPNTITDINPMFFEGCVSLEDIVFPDGICSIGEDALYGCVNLKTISIPSSVTTIASTAFANCAELINVYCNASTIPTTSSNAFENSYADYATLHVPKASISTYQTTAPWSGFGNVIALTEGDEFHELTINVCNALGKVSYGAIDITNSLQKFNIMNGSDAELTFTPNDGYRLESVTVDGVDKTDEVVNGELTLSNITTDVIVEVHFMTAGETTSLTIGSTGMATFCSSSDLDFTEVDGVKAYVGAGFNRTTGTLTMLEVTDVPAGTGIIVKGGAGNYEVPVRSSASVYANLLQGVTSATNISQTADGFTNYILGNGSKGLGFYIVSATGGSLSAGKAYLRIPTSLAGSRSVIDVEFGEGVTGINDVEDMIVCRTYYTLSGLKIEGTPKKPGMYVRDGRVVIIK